MYKIKKTKMLNGSKSNSSMNVNILNTKGYIMMMITISEYENEYYCNWSKLMKNRYIEEKRN